MKRYFDLYNKNGDQTYDAKAARKNSAVDFSFVDFRNPKKYIILHIESKPINSKRVLSGRSLEVPMTK